jgi:hypothetical protein
VTQPNYQQAANDGLLGINDQSPAADVQWSAEDSSLNWIFPQAEPTTNRRMTDLTRQEVDAKLTASEAKVDARLANFDTSIKTGFAELSAAMQKQSSELAAAIAKQAATTEKQTDTLRIEMAKQSGDVRTEMAAIRAEMHKGTADLLKWGAGIAFAAVASTVGLLTYINKSTDKPAPQAAAQAATPLVVAVPAGSTLLNPAPQAPAATASPPAK